MRFVDDEFLLLSRSGRMTPGFSARLNRAAERAAVALERERQARAGGAVGSTGPRRAVWMWGARWRARRMRYGSAPR